MRRLVAGAPSEDGDSSITQHARLESFHDAEPASAPTRIRWRPGAAFLLAKAARPVNTAAWFALSITAPLALLAVAATATQAGAPKAAGFWAAMLLAPAIVLALRSLESRRSDLSPEEQRDQDLARAFCLTTGQACGLLFVVAAGVRFSGEAVAVGLSMAGVPLTLAVVGDIWRRLFPKVEARLADVEVSVSRNWKQEWAEAERLRAPVPRPVPITPMPQRPRTRVTLDVRPMPMDEAWMRGLQPAAEPGQNGSGWMSGGVHPRLAPTLNSSPLLQ